MSIDDEVNTPKKPVEPCVNYRIRPEEVLRYTRYCEEHGVTPKPETVMSRCSPDNCNGLDISCPSYESVKKFVANSHAVADEMRKLRKEVYGKPR